MRENFKPSLAFTLAFEGGFVNHPKDPGGATNKGITIATLRRFKPGASIGDLKNISDDQVQRIYRDGYWSEVRADTLAAGIDGAMFDYAVNSGPGAALKALKSIMVGPADKVVKALCGKRLSIYRTFKHWATFGKGWTRRVTAGEALWVKWALAAANDDAVVKQQLDDEAIAATKTANNQTKGAGGIGAGTGGGAVAVDPASVSDHVAAWIIGGAIVAAALLVAWLLWRAYVNRQRAHAYAVQAEDLL